MQTVRDFCKLANITEDQFDGLTGIDGTLDLPLVTSLPNGFNPAVGGSLYLNSVTTLPPGFNPTVGGDLYLNSVTTLPDWFNPTVGGSLNLRSVTSLPDWFNPTVGGSLNLSLATSLPDWFNPTVGGSLNLQSVTSLPNGFNPIVGDCLDLRSITSLPNGFNPTVGGSLNLPLATSLPNGFNPKVGGSLYLNSVTSLPDGFNPTVGGSLYLNSITSLPNGFNPTVGGSIYSRFDITSNALTRPLTWQNGKYILIDGILIKRIKRRGNVITGKRIGKDEIVYAVNDGNKYAHGSTITEATNNLIYQIGNRDKSEFENLKLSDSLTFEQSIECYRVITGACSFGVRNYVESKLTKRKAKYTISEIIELTEYEYGGSTFANFFKQ